MAKIARQMRVQNTDFLVTKVAEGLPPTQLLRELTQNAVDAKTGKLSVRWTYDPAWLATHGVYKLCVIDTGSGMTRKQLENGIGDFASSGRSQASDKNFGVGAKIASIAASPAGVLYRTWVEGAEHGWSAKLILHDGTVGLAELSNGEPLEPVAWSDAPDSIQKAGHGTVVTLLGTRLEADTTLPPSGVDTDTASSRWIGQSLARRYFRFPEDLSLDALETHANATVNPRQMRAVNAQSDALAKYSSKAGSVGLGDVTVHWWIVPERTRDGSSMDLLNLLSGHVGVLFDNDIYQLWSYRKRGSTLLQDFGIRVGGKNVVLYLEPSHTVATADLQRSRLVLISGGELPIEEWAERFVEHMPQELRQHVNAQAAKASFDRERLSKRLNDLFSTLGVGRFVRSADGDTMIDTNQGVGAPGAGSGGNAGASSGGPTPGMGKLAGTVATEQGSPGKRRDVAIPEIYFCSDSIRIIGEQEVRPMEEFGIDVDRAASYRMASDTLYVNLDFRAYRTLETHLATELLSENEKSVSGEGGCAVVRPHLLDAYVFKLAEAVITVRLLARSGSWSREAESSALSPEALTLAALQRASIVNEAKLAFRARS